MTMSAIGEHGSATAVAVASAAIAVVLVHLLRRPTRKRCTIPGPKPWPFIGNVLDINVRAPWLSYTEWGKTFGGVFLTTAFGLDVVVINDETIARELLDYRSSKYSGRLSYPTAEPYGFDFVTTVIGHTDEWRAHRRLFHQHFRADVARQYRDMQLRKAHELMSNIRESPEDYREHIQTFASSIIMSAVYGYQARPTKDTLIQKMAHVLEIIIQAGAVEKALLVGLFPFVKYIPAWLPGGRFNAAACRESISSLAREPFLHLKETIEPGCQIPSIGYSGLSRQAKQSADFFRNDSHRLVRDMCGSAFAAGSETTSSTLLIFLLAMVHHPAVQERAYNEIIRVCGLHRLPTFTDRPSLPYVEAIIRETLRWYPVLPLGVPHRATEDDVYRNDLIPEATIVLVNAWALSRDEERFPQAELFTPERFLTGEGTLIDITVDFAFGFGRRICPGRHFADASLWAAIVSMLAMFRIEKLTDEHGVEIDFVPEWVTGVTSYPRPFPCRLVPRQSESDANTLLQL